MTWARGNVLPHSSGGCKSEVKIQVRPCSLGCLQGKIPGLWLASGDFSAIISNCVSPAFSFALTWSCPWVALSSRGCVFITTVMAVGTYPTPAWPRLNDDCSGPVSKYTIHSSLEILEGNVCRIPVYMNAIVLHVYTHTHTHKRRYGSTYGPLVWAVSVAVVRNVQSYDIVREKAIAHCSGRLTPR